jgi:hypothetical protein
MVRPSRSDTLKVSLVNFTLATRSSAVIAEVRMPSLDKGYLLLQQKTPNPP